MRATIKYILSPAGQRAAIAAGLSGAQEQLLAVEVNNGDLDLFSVQPDGSLAKKSMPGVAFDAPLTPEAALSVLRRRIAGEAEAAAQEAAARRQRGIDALRAVMAAPDGRPNPYGDGKRVSGPGFYYLGIDDSDPEVASLARQAIERAENQKKIAAAEYERKNAMAAEIEALPQVYFLRNSTLTATGKLKLDLPDCDWARRVDGIDAEQKGAYAFLGQFVRDGNEVEVGTLILVHNTGGSRRRPTKSGALWIAAPRGLRRVMAPADWRIECRDEAIRMLAADPADNIRRVDEARIAAIDQRLATLAARAAETGFEEVRAAIADRTTRLRAARETLAAELADLDAAGPEAAIDSVDAAAAAIVTAGYRALAKVHHPDAGGNAAAMAMLAAAKAQLVELLKLAGGVK